MVFIDSSHEYWNTRAELDAWYPALAPGGLIVLHDSSEFAAGFDVTAKGGVRRALARVASDCILRSKAFPSTTMSVRWRRRK